ncbi:MAG: APC family permease, partial [Myxococcota bacterium]
MRVARTITGAPRRLRDRSLFHTLSLIPFLAWVGLGADGLSSSAYGPDEAFRALGAEHRYLAIPLALAVALTVALISACYMKIIAAFPAGGGGYVVATKLLGPRTGLVAAGALVVDYVLTISVSIAAGADALFSLSPGLGEHKVAMSVVAIALLAVLNIRGIKESIVVLTPIFLLFVVTHIAMIAGGVAGNIGHTQAVLADAHAQAGHDLGAIGVFGVLVLLARAYSMGAGTFTGIEAISNGLPVLREPRVENGKRTMVYMACSLAFTAAGILVCYLLVGAQPSPGKTLNAVLSEKVFGGLGSPSLARVLVGLTLASEGALLLVAAQTGFIGGPRIMANMASDNWLPRRFAALSDRFTTQNGVFLISGAAVAFLIVTGGSTHALVVMYSINVFVTFTLSMLGMARAAWQRRRMPSASWHRDFALHSTGSAVCAAILVVMLVEKLGHGGWLTILVTGGFVGVCLLIRRHYDKVARMLHRLDKDLADIALTGLPTEEKFSPKKPTAVVLVGGFGGFGVHTMLTVQRTFPGFFKQFCFVSIAVVDTGTFKGADQVEALGRKTEGALQRYVDLAQRLGFPATYETTVDNEAVE